jgi:hypothetical protein
MTLRQIISQLRDEELDYEVRVANDLTGKIDVYPATKTIVVS